MTEQISQADIDSTIAEARRQIADNWGWFLALGILLIIAGVAAIAFPLLSTIATKVALGWIFLIAGALIVVHAFSIRQWQGFLLSLLIGALYLAAGAWLAFTPFAGVVALTILLAALFLAEGVLEVIMGLRIRPHEGWGWLLLSGLVAIAVGVLISAELPSSAAWAIGLLTGINLLSSGVSFVALALAGRRVGRGAPGPPQPRARAWRTRACCWGVVGSRGPLLAPRPQVLLDRRSTMGVEAVDGLEPPRLALLALALGPHDGLPIGCQQQARAGVGHLDAVAAG